MTDAGDRRRRANSSGRGFAARAGWSALSAIAFSVVGFALLLGLVLRSCRAD